jgi:cell division protein ZapA
MPKIDISINGRLYPVSCDEGQEARVHDLAGMVDSRVRQLAGPNGIPGVGETHFLVLAGLMLADELTETRAGAPAAASSSADHELLVAAVDHLTDRVTSIADKLDRA